MKRVLILIIPILVLLSCGGSEDIKPGDTFVKFFGGNASLELRDMIYRNGGDGLVLLGTRDGEVIDGDLVFEEKNFYVVETGPNGNPVKQKMIEVTIGATTLHYNEEAARITAIDNGYLLIGTVTNYPSIAVVGETVSLIVWARLDNNFDVVNDEWFAVGDTINNYVGADINLMSDDGVLVAGYTDANGSNDFFYQKINPDASIDWSRIQTRGGSDDRLIRALPLKSGGYALFGQTETLSGDGEPGINVERTIIDIDGIIQNSLIYGITDSDGENQRDDYPSDVLERPGGFAIVGTSYVSTTNYQPFIMLVDLQGAQNYEEVFTSEFTNSEIVNANARGVGVVQNHNNDYVIVGAIDKYIDPITKEARGSEALIMRTNQEGKAKGGVLAQGLVNGNDVAVRALRSADGSILIGATYEFGSALKQFALLKVNANGELKR